MSSAPLPPLPKRPQSQHRPPSAGSPTPRRAPPVEPPPNYAAIIVAAVALAVIGVGGYFAYEKLKTPVEVVKAPETPKPEPEKKPEAVPEPDGEPPPVKVPEPEKPAPKVEPEKPKEIPKEPLPGLESFLMTNAKGALVLATAERIKDGRWDEHVAQLKTNVREAVARRMRSAGNRILDSVIEKEALPLALAQLAIIERFSPENFSEWTKKSPAFAEYVLTSRGRSELLANNLAPEDSLPDVLRVWESLDAKATSAAEKMKYQNLALALALIHDRKNGETHAGEVYDYYVNADAKRRLYVDFAKISPDELVWGVGDSRFGIAGFEWSSEKLKHSASKLGDAYAQIPYRMNHADYPEYTPENILKMGGVCQQQAEFCESNARSRGVPAAFIGGVGSRGGHAWVAMRGERGWANKIGRYEDGYACGHARNPQTGKSFREWDFFLFDDPGRKNGNREVALCLVRAASALPAEDVDARLDLLEAAARRNPANPAPWRAWVEVLSADKKERSLEFWQKLVNEYRIALKKNPDFFDLSDTIETEKIFPKQDPGRVAEMLRTRRHQAIRENPMRFDLLLNSIRREAAYYKERKDTNRLGLLYNGSFRSYGDNLPAFIGLANDFAEISKESPEIRRAALTVMENVFNKEVDSKLKGDAFRLPMEARVCKKLSEVFTLDGNERKADRYAKRAEEIAKSGEEKRAAMR